MAKLYIGFSVHAIVLRKAIVALIFINIVQFSFSQITNTAPALLPGAKVYDVTKPETYGGTLKATPNDPSDDDAVAINAALSKAFDVAQANDSKSSEVFQQVVLIPKGDYHIHSTLLLPRTLNDKENGIWIFGEGADKTRFILKTAAEIGEFGSPTAPKPVVQIAPYTYAQSASGNTNFQLFCTDFSVIIPSDQPNAVGISYGSANMGGLRNIHIKAEGSAGHTGLALIQWNNGPGFVENITVEGFNTGIEVSDGWGETFTFSKIKLLNQNKGGIGFILDDKMLGIDNLISEQMHEDVTPLVLFDKNTINSEFGGMGHLTLLNSTFKCHTLSNKPIIDVKSGHLFVRNISTSGYSNALINDYGVARTFDNAQIVGEYVSLHGKTKEEEPKVVLTYENAPANSINLPITSTPEIDKVVWDKLAEGNYTIVSQNNLVGGTLNITTDWVIVDPSKFGDDTELLQAALNSGARYVGLLNNKSFLISKNLVVNANNAKVELIYGYMTDVVLAPIMHERTSATVVNNKTLFTFETGSAESITIKGLRFLTNSWDNSDVLLFQNNAAQTLIFEDLRCKHAPRAYRNGPNSYGQKIYFENVEFAYNGLWYDIIMRIDKQKVIARQLNLEAPILVSSKTFQGVSYKTYTILPRLYNNGSEIAVISQKMGELNGVFAETVNGGKTELLSTFFNVARTDHNANEQNLTNFVVSGTNSDFCMVGQERIRTTFDANLNATLPLPNKNKFGMYTSNGVQNIIESTSMPTYLNYSGFNAFNDTDYDTNDKKNHFRVAGLLRVITDETSAGIAENSNGSLEIFLNQGTLYLTSTSQLSQIIIYDVFGRKMYAVNCQNQTTHQISTSCFSSGLYLIYATDNGGKRSLVKYLLK